MSSVSSSDAVPSIPCCVCLCWVGGHSAAAAVESAPNNLMYNFEHYDIIWWRYYHADRQTDRHMYRFKDILINTVFQLH